ncbi:MAG: phosphatase PAP2 family protein [Bacteroidetes bacterium]|nr:phosphatase PAP2 family protein [Bacteroidota bacterium]MBL0070558.1 phosphatase PAP2 family protein [Bacteroidota bacterium]
MILLISPPGTFAQTDSANPKFFNSFLKDGKQILIAPFHWDKKDVANLTLATGATAFVMLYDEKLQSFVVRNQNKGLEKFGDLVIDPFGNGLYALPILGGIYLSALSSGNKYDKNMMLLSLEGFIFSAGLATGSKILAGRDRPVYSYPWYAHNFNGPLNDFPADGSFVSRHTSVAFTLATILSRGYGQEKKWVPIVAYSLASMVALSRSYQQEHWASDVLGGAILGYVTGRFVFDLNYKRVCDSKVNILSKTY